MLQLSDSEDVQLKPVLEYFRSVASQTTSGYPTVSDRAVASYLGYSNYCKESPMPRPAFADTVRGWLMLLFMQGKSLSTAVRYLKTISGMYGKGVKQNILPADDIFRHLMTILREKGPEIWNSNVTAADFERLTAMFSGHVERKYAVAADMLLFSLINGAMPLIDVARLKADRMDSFGEDSRTIAQRNREPVRKYIFDLRQSLLTPRQLLGTVHKQLVDLFMRYGIPLYGNPDETIRSYMTYGALRAGCSPQQVAAMFGTVPAGIRVLGIYDKPTAISDDTRQDIAESAARLFLSNPMRWYAMRLRPRVTYDELTTRLKIKEEGFKAPELFYPCREIAKRVGKKLIFQHEPIIRDIVYFHARVTDIYPLFNRIGDLAWCYKTDGRSGSEYAVISDISFRRFRTAIGCFTPDDADILDPAEPLRENDAVVITGGLLNGRSGRLTKICSDTPDGIARYIVEIWNELRDRKLEASVDARQLHRLSDIDRPTV